MKTLTTFCLALLSGLTLAHSKIILTNVATGGENSYFITSDGSLWGMGNNEAGQLGVGVVFDTNQPQLIVSGGVAAVAVGNGMTTDAHCLFLKSDGSLWGMGGNDYGQLGDGSTNNSPVPEEIVSSGVIAIGAGTWHSFYIKTDGSLWAMGRNNYGQLGDGTTNNHSSPVQIIASNVVSVAAGVYHSLCVKADGSLWAMGRNDHGQLGVGNPPFTTNSPMQILSSNVVAIAAADSHSLLLKSDGSLWATGYNEHGQLGIGTSGTTADSYAFRNVRPSSVTSIAAGSNRSLFTKSDGSLWGMGEDFFSELGDGGLHDLTIPEQIFPTNVLQTGGGVVAAAGGELHSLFLRDDGSLWGMGWGFYGELGDGFNGQTSFPKQILPRPRPILANSAINQTNLLFSGTCQFGGIFYLLRSTNLTQPVGQWQPIATNYVNNPNPDNYSVILTNEINSGGPVEFYILESR